MKKVLAILLLCGLLCGCSGETREIVRETTVAAPTIPPDGNAADVTCKGSYCVDGDEDAEVASVADRVLTNRELQVWYWAEAAKLRQEPPENGPDFAYSLDVQLCGMDGIAVTWQQYLLQQALTSWHSAQALICQGEAEGLPKEAAYQPQAGYYEYYLTDMPATRVLYGFNESYRPNSMHQAYLDGIPELLDTLAREAGYTDSAQMAKMAFGSDAESVTAWADACNRGYMYFTSLTDYLDAPDEEQISGEGESCVTIRHILLTAEQEDGTTGEAKAMELLETWLEDTKATEADFAELAHQHSQDTATAPDGGAYRNLHRGQLIPELDRWCFDEKRQPGDTEILYSSQGCHILYFCGRQDLDWVMQEQERQAREQGQLIAQARQDYPMMVDYSVIALKNAAGTVSAADVLYPDIAHERFPEVPLYLQQDYPDTMYGDYKLRTNGCGITSLAMAASYLADDELTPPELSARFGRYSRQTGTDGSLFEKEPAGMGFYLEKKSYDWREAREYMEKGHLVVVVQYRGYWTSGGHYLVLERLSEDGRVQVRDSNIYNYGKLRPHKEDLFGWDVIIPKGMCYWIYDHKITNIGACSRCGDPEHMTGMVLEEEYLCHKCEKALLRRNVYLSSIGRQ